MALSNASKYAVVLTACTLATAVVSGVGGTVATNTAGATTISSEGAGRIRVDQWDVISIREACSVSSSGLFEPACENRISESLLLSQALTILDDKNESIAGQSCKGVGEIIAIAYPAESKVIKNEVTVPDVRRVTIKVQDDGQVSGHYAEKAKNSLILYEGDILSTYYDVKVTIATCSGHTIVVHSNSQLGFATSGEQFACGEVHWRFADKEVSVVGIAKDAQVLARGGSWLRAIKPCIWQHREKAIVEAVEFDPNGELRIVKTEQRLEARVPMVVGGIGSVERVKSDVSLPNLGSKPPKPRPNSGGSYANPKTFTFKGTATPNIFTVSIQYNSVYETECQSWGHDFECTATGFGRSNDIKLEIGATGCQSDTIGRIVTCKDETCPVEVKEPVVLFNARYMQRSGIPFTKMQGINPASIRSIPKPPPMLAYSPLITRKQFDSCPQKICADVQDIHRSCSQNDTESLAGCITYKQAAKFAKWAGGRLPNMSELQDLVPKVGVASPVFEEWTNDVTSETKTDFRKTGKVGTAGVIKGDRLAIDRAASLGFRVVVDMNSPVLKCESTPERDM